METTPAGWQIIDRSAGVLARSYHFNQEATATTFVARMGNGQLVVVSPATDLDEAAAAELRSFGEVGALVANNGLHHLGQAAWRKRFPAARCFAPQQAIKRIQKKNPEAGAFEPLSALAALTGPDVGFREVLDTRAGECWFWAKIAGGHAWYLSDTIANIPRLPSSFFGRLFFKLSHSAPGLRVFHLALLFLVKNKRGALRQLLDDMAAHPPTVAVPAHGDILDQPGLATELRILVEKAL